ncbi:hypothetical protein P280DRAFT_392117 [Massarina eburnea CBS 473.64]|uniref:DUF3431 domain containing protein n=1 Tax=Massarina eburnea CBS 473.64 TaxID=1395130 RepID=A0A6A6SB05_9PLEO|nr:hypothetical protein P280DRAFT_392117 [Massarina eburnea CBS 473.64]
MLFHPRIGLWGHETETEAHIPAPVLTEDTAKGATPAQSGDKQEDGAGKVTVVDGVKVDGGESLKGGKGKARRTAVVVASQKSENTTWLEEHFPQWEKFIYHVDDATAELTVVKNKGRESMVYLTFIIDNYAKLPDNILFIHPTRYQWHNDDLDYDGLPMLRRFQLPYLEREGYVNIRCAWSLGCPAEIKPLAEEGEHRDDVHAGGDYKKAFQVLFPGREVPQVVGVSCCAQFAATREKVRESSREEYVRLRKWLLETDLDDSISGRVLEYSWHMIFGKNAVHCPAAKECYCKVFGLCNLDCKDESSCGHYILPPFSSLPEGWPYVGWDKEQRSRAGAVD